jgi:hypothetical protein
MVHWWVLVNSGHVLDLQLPVITEVLVQNQGFFFQIPQVGVLARVPSFNTH